MTKGRPPKPLMNFPHKVFVVREEGRPVAPLYAFSSLAEAKDGVFDGALDVAVYELREVKRLTS